MCTVTFLPKGKLDFILTSNRDEDPSRASHRLVSKEIAEKTVYYPQDPKAGGTWFASDKSDFTLCLLNGGFEKHKHEPPYRLSRGILLLDFFKTGNLTEFISSYWFEGIEPFTLIVVEHRVTGLALHQLVWDEKELNHQVLNQEESYIWSSSTLYPQPVRNERKAWFEEWLTDRPSFEQSDILEFHQFGGKGDAWNDFVMNREDKVKTVSVTSIDKSETDFNFEHKSLV